MNNNIPSLPVEENKPKLYAGVLICKDGTKHTLSPMDKILLGDGEIDIATLDKIYNSEPNVHIRN